MESDSESDSSEEDRVRRKRVRVWAASGAEYRMSIVSLEPGLSSAVLHTLLFVVAVFDEPAQALQMPALLGRDLTSVVLRSGQ